MIKAVYIRSDPKDYLIDNANQLKATAVFLDYQEDVQHDADFVRNGLGDRADVIIVLDVFQGSDLLKLFPDAVPVESSGNQTSNAHYFSICPTHPGVRNEVLKRVSKILEVNPKGLWLNHIRYPTIWNVPNPEILDTCYCDRCMNLFSQYIGEEVNANTIDEKALLIDGSYYIEWLEFKAKQITSMVENIRDAVIKSGCSIKLGLFAVPWEDKEYGAGIKRIVAQDFSRMVNYVDIVSPKLFRIACGKDVDWVKGKTEYYWQFGIPILPFISTENLENEEFGKVLKRSNSGNSLGIGIDNLQNLTDNKELFEVLKNHFSCL